MVSLVPTASCALKLVSDRVIRRQVHVGHALQGGQGHIAIKVAFDVGVFPLFLFA